MNIYDFGMKSDRCLYKFSYINDQGLEVDYDTVIHKYEDYVNGAYEYDYFIVVKEGRYGCLAHDGSIIADAVYDEIKYCRNCFKQRYFKVKRNGKCGVILSNGFIQVPCIYDNTYYDGLRSAVVENSDKKGLVYKGQEVLPCTYDKISYENTFVIFEKDGKCGLYDLKGDLILPCAYDEIKTETHCEIHHPEEPFFPNEPVQTADTDELISINNLIFFRKDGKWGYMHGNNRKETPCIYTNIKIVSDYIIPVKKGRYWGFISIDAQDIVPCIYNSIKSYSKNDKYIPVMKDGYWGFIDKTGNKIIPCTYEDLGRRIFRYYYPIKLNGKWGLLNDNAEEIIPCIYDSIEPGTEYCLVNLILKGEKISKFLDI